jgi:hypothetical protein
MVYRFQLAITAVALLTACGGEPNPAAPCPEPTGEFPPTACAYLEGRLTAGGVPITGAGLRVDEFVPTVGYAYASGPAGTDALGRFGLLVLRINEFEPPAVPDTATIFVKIYPTEAGAVEGVPPEDSVAVLMSFAPMGTVVDTTRVELTLETP